MERARWRLEREGPLAYLLMTPEAQQGAPHPVLCFLHGYDEGAPTRIEEGVTRHGPLRPGTPAAVRDFIVIAPQMPVRGDIWHRYAGTVQRIVETAQQQYGGDAQRTFLTGFSFGANAVFDLALLQPGFWAALWAVDPTRVPDRDPQRPVWLSFGQVARFRKQRFIGALGLQPAELGASADRVYLDEGADHVGAATLAYRDERIYAWLRAKRLDARRHGLE